MQDLRLCTSCVILNVYIIEQARSQDDWILTKFSFSVLMDRDEERTRPISSYLSRTCLVNKGLLYGIKNFEKNYLCTCLFSSTEKEASYMQK